MCPVISASFGFVHVTAELLLFFENLGLLVIIPSKDMFVMVSVISAVIFTFSSGVNCFNLCSI